MKIILVRTSQRKNTSEHLKKKSNCKTVLSTVEESVLVEVLEVCAKWGFPLSMFEIRLTVKGYLDQCSRKIPQFKNNTPGEDWGWAFMSRHRELRQKFAENVKRCRSDVSGN